MNKVCTRCKTEKSFSAFFKRSRAKDGLAYECKTCSIEYQKAYQLKKPDKIRETKHRYELRNKDKKAAYGKMRRERDREKVKNIARNTELKKKYGITLDQYNGMREAQGFSCALCGKPESNFKRRLAVDHNHKTGKIRGLLCFPCNKYKVGRHTVESSKAIHDYLVKYDKAS